MSRLVELNKEDSVKIVELTQQLNPNISEQVLLDRQKKAFEFDSYRCLGFQVETELIGVCGVWLSSRPYSGIQAELDHFVINEKHRSKGYGHKFFELIEDWSKNKWHVETIELNTYVQNSGSHKFYFNKNFKILGFHFLKQIKS